MEFFDEDRPRFVFQTRASQKSHPDPIESTEKPNKIFISVSIVVSLVFVAVSLFYIDLEPLKSLLLWLSLSLLVGPFAPSSFTGGSIRVGHGPIIEEEQIDQQQGEIDREPRRKQIQKRSKPQRPDYPPEKPGAVVGNANNSSRKTDQSQNPNVSVNASVKSEESGDWCEEDVEILKKQLVKNPAGKPGRWESVASAFGGRYRVESVIKKAKELGEKKTNENDDYSLFLKNRKPVDARSVEDKTDGSEMGEDDGKKGSWSNGEDIALLNALKVFPKDAPMRWEKIAAAVPGKTKAACMKRVTDMKKDFRSSKAGGESH